jgi:ATP-dependent Clp protease protease subunit
MIFLSGEVNFSSAIDVVASIIEINETPAHERPEEIMLFINSPGGSFAAGVQIVDAVKQSLAPVITYATGMCMSAGLMVLMAGVKGGRAATENTLLMSHQFSAGYGGKEHEMLASRRQMEILADTIDRHYRKCTGKTQAYVRKHLMPAADVYMTAAEAKEHGFIDQVVKVY